MKQGWEVKKLGEVCDVSAGNSAPQEKEFFENGKYPFFRTADVGRLHISSNLIEPKDYLNKKGIQGLRLFEKGTILLPKSGASTFLNHRVILGVDGYVASHLATINTHKDILNNIFLFHFLKNVKAQDLIQDIQYPSLKLTDVKEIIISYPPLPEQKHIVQKLDKLSAETKKLEAIYQQKITNLDDLKKSILQKAFRGEL